MNKIRISKDFKFDASHWLPNHSKCGQIHGHTYKVNIAVEATPDINTGMVIDFHDLKNIVNPVIDVLDHDCINKYIRLPTAENIALWIAKKINKALLSYGVVLHSVKVWETPTCCAKWDVEISDLIKDMGKLETDPIERKKIEIKLKALTCV